MDLYFHVVQSDTTRKNSTLVLQLLFTVVKEKRRIDCRSTKVCSSVKRPFVSGWTCIQVLLFWGKSKWFKRSTRIMGLWCGSWSRCQRNGVTVYNANGCSKLWPFTSNGCLAKTFNWHHMLSGVINRSLWKFSINTMSNFSNFCFVLPRVEIKIFIFN